MVNGEERNTFESLSDTKSMAIDVYDCLSSVLEPFRSHWRLSHPLACSLPG